MSIRLLTVVLGLSLSSVVLHAETRVAPNEVQIGGQAPVLIAPVQRELRWASIITIDELKAAAKDPKIVIVDARKPDDYAKGHIPGAINLSGSSLRTASAKPGKGDSQYFFRTADGSPDVKKYEQILSDSGLKPDDHIIVYGNHAGTADGSVTAMILYWLGHDKVQFLDGIGCDAWAKSNNSLSTEPTTRPVTKYVAKPVDQFIWQLKDVVDNLDNQDVIYYDTRSHNEYTGQDKRDNARGGHIPGAICLDYAAFLNKDKTSLSLTEVQSQLEKAGVTPDKKIVLYCQTATRVSLPLLALKDLGYKNVYIYDASWHEYGNRADTLIVEGENPR